MKKLIILAIVSTLAVIGTLCYCAYDRAIHTVGVVVSETN